MSHASQDEIDGNRLRNTVWRDLHQVQALSAATDEHLNEVLAGVAFDAEGVSKGLRAMFAFDHQWQQLHGELPKMMPLIRAERAGTLDELVNQLNEAWDNA